MNYIKWYLIDFQFINKPFQWHNVFSHVFHICQKEIKRTNHSHWKMYYNQWNKDTLFTKHFHQLYIDLYNLNIEIIQMIIKITIINFKRIKKRKDYHLKLYSFQFLMEQFLFIFLCQFHFLFEFFERFQIFFCFCFWKRKDFQELRKETREKKE